MGTRIVLILLVAPAVFAQEAADTTGPLVSFDSSMASALDMVLLTREDVRLRTDYTEPDSFRLWLVDSLMRHPLAAFDVARDVESLTDSGSVDVPGAVEKAAFWLARTPGERPWLRKTEHLPLLARVHALCGRPYADDDSALDELPSGISRVLRSSLGSLVDAAELQSLALSQLSLEEADSLRRRLPDVILEDPDAWKYTPEQLDSLENEAVDLIEALLPILSRVDRASVAASARALGSCVHELSGARGTIGADSSALGMLLVIGTPMGGIYVGGSDAQRYPVDPLCVIDLGGDDLYAGPDTFRAARSPRASLVYDLAGDDTYRASDFSLGAGYFGVGVLWDASGDDVYEARHFAQGAGVIGVGLLVDERGDDSYRGDTFAQGAGLLGAGLLADFGGRDLYACALYGQGFAQSAGVGLLCDGGGDDGYTAGGRYYDVLRYTDHSLSLSQGFSIGFRPDASGGIGMIVDQSGNDAYSADVFGQAASYWWSVGLIADKGGNDRYSAQQYVQGSGVHLAWAALFDEDGNDSYSASGVSQGCGHDLAFGLLFDGRGHDEYVGEGLVHGAGNANGIGILCDLSGNDVYVTRAPRVSQPFGDARREYGSIGVFLDLNGDDRYIGNGMDGSAWLRASWGVGVDWSGEWGER